ncbi:MAG: chromosome segregation protein SMC [Thermoleophilia bacterium]|nr:chromosome segregation protein SMC [Thermoleophilia bacterium]
MARLRSLRLRGFKTFARPTELVFEPGVTVIIGPNGSGKSNIADAVLWVLGEQSPLNLRGRNMQDVIFSGGAGQGPSAVAEVSLLFEDVDDLLPSGEAELEITRRLTRDGVSEYRINGTPCRLLDIQDLIGALGLGREMHSVVSQGKVESFLSYTPQARRAMVEEAAGVGRLKKRRERVLAKMERTKRNLERVTDIEKEVKAALRPLRQQVAAAERFAEVQEDWALAKSRQVLRALLDVEGEVSQVEQELSEIEARREVVEASLAEIRTRRAAAEQELMDAMREREELSTQWHRARSLAEYFDSRLSALRQRLARVESERERAARRLELAEKESYAAAERLRALEGDAQEQTRLQRVLGWLEVLSREHAEEASTYSELVAQEEEIKDLVFEAEAARSRALQDREFVRRQLQEKERQGGEIEGQLKAALAREEALLNNLANIKKELETSYAALAEIRQELGIARREHEAARRKAQESARAESALEETLIGLGRRIAVLEDLVNQREDILPGAREILKRGQGVLLTDLLSVTPGYERAVVAALGPLAQAVVLGGTNPLTLALQIEETLEVVKLLPGEEGGPADELGDLPFGAKSLEDVVFAPPGLMATLRRLLPPIAIVDADGEWDQKFIDEPLASWRIVLRSGEVIDPGIRLSRRQDLGAETVLRARNELEAALKAREELEQQRREAQEAARQAAEAAEQARKRWQNCEERLRRAERDLSALRGKVELTQKRVEEARAEVQELTQRQQRESELRKALASQLETAERAVEDAVAHNEQLRQQLRDTQARLEAIRGRVTRLEAKKAQAALLEVRLKERLRALDAERGRATTRLRETEQEAARARRRMLRLKQLSPVLESLLILVERLTLVARQHDEALETQLALSKARSENAALAVQDRGGAESDFQREFEELAKRVADLRVRKAHLEERCDLLTEELSELKRKHLAPRSVKPEDVLNVDPGSLAAAVESAQRRLDRIGPINPLAEQECAALEERAKLIGEQRADLEASLARLGQVVQELEEHIESTFSEVFTAVRDHFSSVIAAVFPGAKGKLSLVSSKPLRARRGISQAEDEAAVGKEDGEVSQGIDIEVRFPNKTPRTLSLLSGGEKAMTAVAFLFSLFLAKPCPFYILDEVEASLDDMNIRRFLSLVNRYKNKTQFIIITHQRQTMEIADTLYGVTLEKDGTSRVLSRRLSTVGTKGA